MKLLLEAGANPDARGGWAYDRPLTAAAAGGFAEVTGLLLKAGATRDYFAMAALGDAAGVERQLRESPEVAGAADEAGLMALHHCAKSRLGAADAQVATQLQRIAELLIDHGAAVNALGTPPARQRIRPALPPLVYACIADNQSVAKVLLAHGANPNHRCNWGTPLMQACKYSPTIGTILLKQDARINEAVDEDGRTAIHVMAHFPHPAAVKWLLEHGADPRVRTVDGRTPLHFAARRNSGPRVTQMLIAAGADVNARDRDGRTPLSYAEEGQKSKVAAALIDLGGQR